MFKKIRLNLNSKLVRRIFFTIFIITIFVIGQQIPIPFLSNEIKEHLLLLKNISKVFSVIAIYDNKLNILSLSIYPYLTVSIFMQLAQKLLPYLKDLREQGHIGRQKLNRLNRGLAIFLAFIQGYFMIPRILNNVLPITDWHDKLWISFFLTSGTAVAIWIADLITAKGIGNGFSLLIMVGISKSVIRLFKKIYSLEDYWKIFQISMFLLFILIITIIVYLAYLKILIIYPNKQSKVDNYIPLKINSSGVLPIILVSTLQAFFQFLLSIFENQKHSSFYQNFYSFIIIQNKFGFIFFICLIIFFSVFLSFITVNPYDIAEHLSKQDAYIENCRPGEQTVGKISIDLFSITILGVFFMIFLFSLPYLAVHLFEGIPELQIGGTSFLIIVGVAIETLQQMSSTVHQENYAKLF